MSYQGLFFIRISRTRGHKPSAAEHFGHVASLAMLARDPDEDGREWVDVAFDRDEADALARRWESRSDDPTAAEVVSIGDLLIAGGYGALGRALAAVETSLLDAIDKLKADARRDDSS